MSELMNSDLFQDILSNTLPEPTATYGGTYKPRRRAYPSDFELKQAEFDDARDNYFPDGRSGISYLPSDFLRSGLFSLSSLLGDDDVTCAFPIYQWDSIDVVVPGQFIHYQGPRLTQFHKRILLEIVMRAAGVRSNATLSIELTQFLSAIGRNPCSRNKSALQRALGHLTQAQPTLTKFVGDVGTPFKFLRDASWQKNGGRLELAPSFARMLWSSRTYLPLALRTPLSDGLATALMDLFRAAPQPMYTVKALAAIWQREPVQFGRELGPVLSRLVEIGFLSDYRRPRGKVHVVEQPFRMSGI